MTHMTYDTEKVVKIEKVGNLYIIKINTRQSGHHMESGQRRWSK